MEETEIVEDELVEEVEEEDNSTEDEGDTSETIDWEARAKKAEALIVKHKLEAKAKPEAKTQATPSNVEEVVLLANGMDESLMEQLKKIAAVNGTSLIKAQNDPIFVAVKEKFEREKKSSAASLPASRGAGTAKVKKDFSTPGLSREEHKKLVEESLK